MFLCMSREERTIKLALAILKRSATVFGDSARSDGMQLALRVLLPYVDKRTLTTFWSVAANANPAQRRILLHREYELIEVSVRRHSGVAGESRVM